MWLLQSSNIIERFTNVCLAEVLDPFSMIINNPPQPVVYID